MPDTKISALTAAAAAVATHEFAVNEAGASKKVTGSQIRDFCNTAPVLAAGSATAGTWPKFTPGTLLTTAEDGALEMDADCLYACTDAGNRGLVPIEHFIRADATRTFTSNTAQQAIFNSPTNGALTLETGCYIFELLLCMDTMSATTGNGKFSLIGAGTATLAAILYALSGMDAALDTLTAWSGLTETIATQTAANHSTISTGTVATLTGRGTFEVTVAGTLIPSYAQTTANAAVVKIGSFFTCRRIGSTSMASVGQWT